MDTRNGKDSTLSVVMGDTELLEAAVLVVSPLVVTTRLLMLMIRRAGFIVVGGVTSLDALTETCSEFGPDLIVYDYHSGADHGGRQIAMMDRLADALGCSLMVVCDDQGIVERHLPNKRRGRQIVPKPIDRHDVLSRVRDTLRLRLSERANRGDTRDRGMALNRTSTIHAA